MKRILCGFGMVVIMATGCHSKNDGGGIPADKLNASDSMFLQKATQGNLAEITAGHIADSMAVRDSVKMFGAMMITDHSTAQLSLDSIGNKWSIALPALPDAAHVAMAAMLRTLSGEAFDSAYLGGQLVDHKAAEMLYQDEIQKGSNVQVLAYANRVLPVVQMHLMMVDSLVKK